MGRLFYACGEPQLVIAVAVPGTGNTVFSVEAMKVITEEIVAQSVGLIGRFVCAYHGNITSEVADFKGTLSDSDGDIIAEVD